MPQDPNILVYPTPGAQYLQAPDGTLVPTVGNPLLGTPGVPADVTGKPLTVAPNRGGTNAVIDSAGAPGPNDVQVSGLYNVLGSDVGSVLVLANTQVIVPGQLPPNTGFFVITAVVDSHTVQATKVLPVPPSPMFPDLASGQITWLVFSQNEFPAGDPLAYCAELALPLSVVTPAPGPARFANYDPTLQPVIVNDSAGLFSKVQQA